VEQPSSLPAELRQADINFQRFKWLLKTFLFRCWDRGALWLTVKVAPHSFLTYWLYLQRLIHHQLHTAKSLLTKTHIISVNNTTNEDRVYKTWDKKTEQNLPAASSDKFRQTITVINNYRQTVVWHVLNTQFTTSLQTTGQTNTKLVHYFGIVYAVGSTGIPFATVMGQLHSTWQASSRRRRRSLDVSTCDLLIVPRCRRKTFGCREFSVASPSGWNALSDSVRDPELTLDIFRRHLKTYFTLY